MPDPVDTDALRKLLHNDTAVEVIRLRQGLKAAADEVDRLRAERDDWVRMFCDADEGRRRNWLALDVLRSELVGHDSDTPAWKRVAYQRRELRAVSAAHRRLRTAIENAPHEVFPDGVMCPAHFGDERQCTCWKADAL